MKNLLCATLFVSAIACGDKSDTETGVFAGPVQGLAYATASQHGITDAQGHFSYKKGETVTFRVGGITLGSASGAATVSALDLFNTTLPASERDLRVTLNYFYVTDFNRALNVTALLLALDADGDTTNGLDITAAAVALASATTDFDYWFYAFPGYRLTQLLEAAQIPQKRFFSDGDVVGFMYHALGVLLPAQVVATYSYDAGNDGTVNGTTTYTNGADGLPTQIVTDNENDGSPDLTQALTYNDHGELLARTTVSVKAGNQAIDEIDTYDAAGNVLTRVATTKTNGAVTEVVSSTWTYDSTGAQSSFDSTTDGNGDGTIDASNSETDTYGADGGVANAVIVFATAGVTTQTTTEHLTYASNGDQTAELDTVVTSAKTTTSNTTFTLDDRHNWLTQDTVKDTNGDGTNDYAENDTYTFDDRGNRLTTDESVDSNLDGTPDTDETITNTFDANGHGITQVDEKHASPGNKLVTRTTSTIVYDQYGQLTMSTITYDNDGDGATDETDVQTYTWGSNGEQLTLLMQTDSDGDGVYETQSLYTYTYTTIADGAAYIGNDVLD